MTYPLIVLGAGASYGYSLLEAGVAPLTNELVSPKYLDKHLLDRYPSAGNILSEILPRVGRGESFEQALTKLHDQAKGSKDLLRQFVDLSHYLKDLFGGISTGGNAAHQINNHRFLVNQILRHCAQRALVVSFNYDSLFERNCSPYQTYSQMSDYILGKIKVIKLHGSHDWSYIQRSEGFSGVKGFDSLEWVRKNPEVLDKMQAQNSPHHTEEVRKAGQAGTFFEFPSLALPMTKDAHVCPEQHVNVLDAEMAQVDRVLIIGWKAGDPLLLEHMAKHLRPMAFKVLVVSGGDAEEVAKTITATLGGKTTAQHVRFRTDGFSGLAQDAAATEEFFS